ncbi:hypothetical protein Tco_0978022 [Tanacetum coccineum]|uniref:Hydroxyproline-rich glycoprotein family protein n=1 Tax=Tanacetum coccineum TaxID=301880 RepID=A0ABQ5ELS9_9ASTR
MEQDPDSPPNIWFQPPLATIRRQKPPIDPVVLIILIPILVLVFLFFFLSPFLLQTSHILKPRSVKSTWDSLNIFLVVFAILCGVLARKNEGVNEPTNSVGDSSSSSINSTSVASSGQVFGYSDTKVVSGGLRRSSSSYPDLRNEPLWENNRNRFYDDFDVYNSSPMSRYYGRSRQNELDPVEFSDVKKIFVDTVAPVTVTTAVPPPPQQESSKRHSFRSVGRNVKSYEFEKARTEPPSPPPPPSPAVAETTVKVHRPHHKHTKLERKVSDATKEVTTAISNLSSLYNKQKKRKNKRRIKSESSSSNSSPSSIHSTCSVESMNEGEPRHLLIPPSLPRPPPPPHLPFKFQNLFKKGVKHKKMHSVPTTITLPTPLPPSLPPPPSSIFNSIFKGNKSKRFNSNSSSIMNNVFKTGTKSKRFISTPPPPMTPPRYTTSIRSKKLSVRGSHAPSVTEWEYRNRRSKSHGKPPLRAKTSYYERDDFPPSGSQSPLIPMPPPPPPPFRMTPMKFELRGDFVRVQSTHSSVCSSPDHDDVYSGPISFPSPDVNAKADSYISRLKDEWRMEKNNNHVNKKWD